MNKNFWFSFQVLQSSYTRTLGTLETIFELLNCDILTYTNRIIVILLRWNLCSLFAHSNFISFRNIKVEIVRRGSSVRIRIFSLYNFLKYRTLQFENHKCWMFRKEKKISHINNNFVVNVKSQVMTLMTGKDI